MADEFSRFWQRALEQHGSAEAIDARLPKAKTAKQLCKVSDDRYLAEMAACIFRAGFVWKVIENKWPGFEEVFKSFQPLWLASRSPEEIEDMARDTRIVRNLSKVKAVQDNALMVLDIAREHGSVGQFLSDWPAEDITGLWAYLKKHGSRLGGNSGQYFLRFMGVDTFVLSRDVLSALQSVGVLDKAQASSQRDLKKVQEFFNQLKTESGRPFCELSMILALSVGPSSMREH
ncbi:DNA-3-methyladenine glycosylase I [Spongiibacter sp. KMU-158]|uniref:DNA-3-methyladenine glycosylase I n=1 Tax=Spongiibacter pelagi TaxID=2760804 RepID=A0A927C1E0_9GAMM|nr:DNA-3-methyladenine glycosylase I [Spongiibacter pelagi]MBD2858398.1 DNA-3-methyladenine glycosylase I [Spongiibacter pelagi]